MSMAADRGHARSIADREAAQRFNVAMSRARDRLVRAQAVDRPELDPVGERDQPGAQRGVGQLRNLMCDGWCELRTWNRGLSLAKYRAAAPGTRLGPGRTLISVS